MEKISEKVFKKPIETEYQLLSSEKLPELLKSKDLPDAIKTMAAKNGDEVLDYIYNNNNALTKMLKISGDIPTLKGSDGVIDSLAHIEPNKVKQASQNISKLLESAKSQADLDKFLKQTKNIKGAAVIANILIGAAAIGILQPMMNIVLRKKKQGGETINPAIKKLETQMEQKFAFKG